MRWQWVVLDEMRQDIMVAVREQYYNQSLQINAAELQRFPQSLETACKSPEPRRPEGFPEHSIIKFLLQFYCLRDRLPHMFKQKQSDKHYNSLMHCSNRKCKAVDCRDHFFSLKSLRPDTYYRQTVIVPLCPKTDSDGRVAAFGFPTFNNDKKWFTPAFALDMDKNYTPEIQQQMLYDQQRKIRQTQDSKPEIFIPKPSHKHKYCSICKSNYEDYLEHIQSSPHKKSITKSKYTKHVLDLCSTLFKTQETVKLVSDDSTKQKQESDKPRIVKKRRVEPRTPTEETKIEPLTHPFMVQLPEPRALYNKIYLPPAMSPMGLSYNPLQFGCLPIPFAFQNPSLSNFGYQFFMSPESLFTQQQQQIPIMINNQLEFQ